MKICGTSILDRLMNKKTIILTPERNKGQQEEESSEGKRNGRGSDG
jgi:hypothetical protein